ncbi:phosphodiester glycosidase family protein [Helicovermis profundi]|uniref:Phosphodiester glycosidase domain-containing protein n=1 Tax=Helicovermis profundi TaxID=3065157 RepID=A0AAU9EPY6_9FIRM|nr:hypothetical protein HLPR_25550 [Clostridia bacterium S502]
MKKYILIIVLILSTQITSFADYSTIYTSSNKEILSNGITYEKKSIFTDKGWINLNIMYADLNDKNTYADVLFNSGDITLRKPLSSLSLKENLVSSINGDFFDSSSKSTLGTILSNNKLISTGIHDGKFASFNISKDGIPFLENWKTAGIKLTNENSNTLMIEYKNKPYLEYNRAIIFDKNWRDYSYGNTLDKDIIEIVIKDDVITDIRKNLEKIKIPDKGYVISAVGRKISEIEKNFSLGDKISINYDDNFSNIKTSIGGGAIIVKNGQLETNLSLSIKGSHPRTAIGITKDRKKLILVQIDGRKSFNPGVSENELSNIMISLGAYNAINMDGGGSSEMLIKRSPLSDISIVNTPSDGNERKIFTGLGIFDNSPKEDISKLVSNLNDNLILNIPSSIKIWAEDVNHHRYELDKNDISITISGIKANITNDSVTPTSEGDGVLTIKYKDLILSKQVHSSDDIVDLKINNNILFLDPNETFKFNISAIDSSGHSYILNNKNLFFTLNGDIGTIDTLGTLSASHEKTKGIIRISFNNIDKYIPVVIGNDSILLDDFEDDKSLINFISYPENSKGYLKKIKFSYNNSFGYALNYDFTYTNKTRAAYLNYKEPITLPENTKKIGLWVFGNYGNSHWLRAKLSDETGKMYNITFEKNVNWKGWKYVEALLPKNIESPAKVERIYLVEDNSSLRDQNIIVIDDLSAILNPTIDFEIPKDKTNYKSYKFNDASSSLINEKNNLLSSINVNKNNDIYINKTMGNIRYIHIINSNGSIRENGYGQWLDLINLEENIKEKGLIIDFSDQLKFKDPNEEILFYKTLKNIKKSNNISILLIR